MGSEGGLTAGQPNKRRVAVTVPAEGKVEQETRILVPIGPLVGVKGSTRDPTVNLAVAVALAPSAPTIVTFTVTTVFCAVVGMVIWSEPDSAPALVVNRPVVWVVLAVKVPLEFQSGLIPIRLLASDDGRLLGKPPPLTIILVPGGPLVGVIVIELASTSTVVEAVAVPLSVTLTRFEPLVASLGIVNLIEKSSNVVSESLSS